MALAVALTASPMNVASAQQPAGVVEVKDTKMDSLTKKIDELRSVYGIDIRKLESFYLQYTDTQETEEMARGINVFHKALQM